MSFPRKSSLAIQRVSTPNEVYTGNEFKIKIKFPKEMSSAVQSSLSGERVWISNQVFHLNEFCLLIKFSQKTSFGRE